MRVHLYVAKGIRGLRVRLMQRGLWLGMTGIAAVCLTVHALWFAKQGRYMRCPCRDWCGLSRRGQRRSCLACFLDSYSLTHGIRY